MVRAIDAQHVILQSNTVERIQQIQQQHADMQQRYFALQLSEHDRILKEKVKKSEETDKLSIKEKEEHEKGRKNSGRGGENNSEFLAGEESSEAPGEGGHINITI